MSRESRRIMSRFGISFEDNGGSEYTETEQTSGDGIVPAKNSSVFRTLSYLISLSSMRLYKSAAETSGEQAKSVSQTYTLKPALGVGGDKNSMRINALLERLLGSVVFWFATYVSIKYVILAVLQFERDRLLHDWNPLLRNNGTQLERCVVRADVIRLDEDTEQQARLETLTYWLDLLADPMINMRGLGSLIFSGLASVIVIFFHAPVVFVQIFDVSVDHLTFLYSPSSERRRIKRDLSNITANVINSSDKVSVTSGSGARKTDLLASLHDHQLLKDLHHYRDEATHSIFFDNHKRYNEEMYIYERMDGEILGYVRPANLSCEWRNELLIMSWHFILSQITSSAIFIVAIMTTVFYSEVELRTNHRLEVFRCTKWWPGGVPIEDRIHLEPLSSAEEREAYLSYDGSQADFLKLAIFIELKYYLKPAIALALAELTLIFVLCGSWVTFAFSLYAQIYADKMIWLRQISRQVDYCIASMSEHKHLTDEKASDGKDDQHLTKAITVAYLNFELFRRQQRKYQLLSNFLLLQPFLLSAIILSLIYSISMASMAARYNTVLLLVASYLMAFINGFMLTGALRTKRIDALMKNIVRLLASGAINSMQRSHVISIWTRQMFSIKEARQLFAPSLFGLSLSYDKLLTINAYLLAVWLALFRFSSTPRSPGEMQAT